ncbi:MAG: ATP-grasp domain-containing protein [Dorea sp.]|nr:ATP-grasp domain-containing protein [Dorea sp.]
MGRTLSSLNKKNEYYGQKRLLILGASDFQLPAILEAKKMGIYVGAADINPQAAGIPYADEFFRVSTIDEKGVLEAAKEFRAEGIITLCTDMPVRALAYVCEEMGLVGLDYESAIRSTDKGAMIRAFEKNDVEHPGYMVVSEAEDYRNGHTGKIITQIEEKLKYPLITKPTDNSGSRGIMLVENREQLSYAIQYSSMNGRNGDIIIEEYMRGPEVSVEMIVMDGIAHVIQITDKLTSGPPHFVELGHSEPSGLPYHVKEKIADLAGRAARAVGIKNGTAHAEVILTDDGPKMVEIGARMGGDCITTHLVPFSTGINMTKEMIKIALGERPDIERKFDKGSAIRFIRPMTGRVISISGVDEAGAVPGVKAARVQCTSGQELKELENGTGRIGYVIAQAETSEEAVRICENALKLIKINVAAGKEEKEHDI